jgi:signal transduction histidine kinase
MELVLEHLRQSLYDPTYRATYELPVHRRNGEHAYLEVSVTSVCRDGAVVGQQAIARDVSEKKALEAEVARRTRELQISRERQEELRTYMTLVTRAIEEERKRVARELHDDTAQSLVALTRSLDALGLSLAGSAGHATARQRIEEVRAIAESILASIRRFSRDLRPSLLDDLGLVAALEWLASETQRLTGITAVCEVHGEERRLEPDVELALFRIAQEALSNVRRHAQAVHAWVTIIFGDGFVQLDVRDDGIGFVPVERPADLASARGLGLRGMRERAQIIGAEFAVQSAPGAGTTVRVRVRG